MSWSIRVADKPVEVQPVISSSTADEVSHQQRTVRRTVEKEPSVSGQLQLEISVKTQPNSQGVIKRTGVDEKINIILSCRLPVEIFSS